MTRELREREIVQLRREIAADPPTGCLKTALWYIVIVFVFAVIGIIAMGLTTWITDDLTIGVIIGMALWLILYIILLVGMYGQWRERRNRKARLDQLLREEREDIERTKHTYGK